MTESATSTRRSERMAQTAVRLTTVSRRMTAERGLSGFTIEEVCDEVGVSRRTFFNYFPSKEEAVVGVAEDADTERLVQEFLERGARGWPAVLDDMIDLAVRHVNDTGFGLAEHADLLAAINREPRLLARFIDMSREREAQLTELVALREGTSTQDPYARAVVQIVATTLRITGERLLEAGPGADLDFSRAIHHTLEAIRAVTAPLDPEAPRVHLTHPTDSRAKDNQ